MKLLALESSTLLGGVSFLEDGKVLLTEESMRQNSHSEALNVFVGSGLKKLNWKLSDIDLFAVGQGPGSFTGVRVAANIGKTFSYINKKKLICTDTLSCLAWPAMGSSVPVFAMINAYKNMVYYGVLDVSGQLPVFLNGPSVIPVRELKTVVTQNCLAIGDGYPTYAQYLDSETLAKLFRNPEKYSDYASSKSLAEMAFLMSSDSTKTMDWNSFTPLYIRASEAEETKQGIVFTALK